MTFSGQRAAFSGQRSEDRKQIQVPVMVTVTKPVSVTSRGNGENKEKGERIKEKIRCCCGSGFAHPVIARSIGLMGGDEAISTVVTPAEAGVYKTKVESDNFIAWIPDRSVRG